MTIDECREYLPENWLPILEADPMLWEIFSEHEYGLEQEAVPPFLIQELRGGNLEHLRPLLSLYGEPGLELLEGLGLIFRRQVGDVNCRHRFVPADPGFPGSLRIATT